MGGTDTVDIPTGFQVTNLPDPDPRSQVWVEQYEYRKKSWLSEVESGFPVL